MAELLATRVKPGKITSRRYNLPECGKIRPVQWLLRVIPKLEP
jgi:hypothetical protein